MDWEPILASLVTGLLTGSAAYVATRRAGMQQLRQLEAEHLARRRSEELNGRRDAYGAYLGLLSRFRSESIDQVLGVGGPLETRAFRTEHDVAWAKTMLFASADVVRHYDDEFRPRFTEYWDEITTHYLNRTFDEDVRHDKAVEAGAVFDRILRPAIFRLAQLMQGDLRSGT